MEHQFPGAISGDEHMLAELMLPDQAHMRDQDWTIFFLHKDTANELEDDDGEDGSRRRRRTRGAREREGLVIGEGLESDEQELEEESVDDEDYGDDDDDGYDSSECLEGPPLIYVLNLVNTKPDKTAPR
jgi:Docking domain of Afi1 for Arf3 in vesicle trafficking